MYCSYHPTSGARVQCASCARALCAGCDHRIKGYPYCQDCIVLGIESLARHSANARSYGSAKPKSKARLAALCALLPGLGAVLNRQNIKAIVHFVTIVGLFQLSDLNVLEGFFALAGVVAYVYSIIDAYRSAQLIAEGESPALGEERFKRQLAKRAPAIGLFMIVTGLLMFIELVRPLGLFISFARLLPVALIFLGGYLLTRYFKRSQEAEYGRNYSNHPPYSLVPGPFTGSDPFESGRRTRSGGQR